MSKVRYYRGTDKLEVYLMSTNDPTTAELVKLNPTLPTAAEGGQSDFISSGTIDLSQFNGTYCIGFRYVSPQQANYTTWQIDDFKFGGKALLQTIDDFETMNGGTPTSQTQFADLTSTKGWKAFKCGLLIGGESDAPPTYSAIGKKADGSDRWAYAVHLNGSTDANKKSHVESPVISGGMKKLSFGYGYFLTDPGVKFHVRVMSATSPATEIQDIIIDNPDAVKGQAYYYTAEINTTSDVVLYIESLSKSGSTSNKDRFAIWNITWEK